MSIIRGYDAPKPRLALVIVPLAVLAIWLAPIVAIWAINALFGTAITVTLKAWFAALLLIVLIGR